MKSFSSTVHYESSLVSPLKRKAILGDRMKKDLSPLLLDFGCVRFYFPRHFGFCYGVENAIDITFKALVTHSDKRIFLLSELIHNPYINNYFEQKGIRFLMKPDGTQLIDFDTLTPEDIVIIPAFGTTVAIEQELTKRGISFETYQSTCPFVVKVWNRAKKMAAEGYSIIIHGTPGHEETRSTFSHVEQEAACVVVRDMEDAHRLACYVRGEKTQQMFEKEFQGLFSEGFEIKKHLRRVALVNQTTMLAEETKAINAFLRSVLIAMRPGQEEDINYYMSNTNDTLCYATNDNQHALEALLKYDADLVFAVGGYNSSNTSHLVEMCQDKGLLTYFVYSPLCLKDESTIEHFDVCTKSIHTTKNYIPQQLDEDPINIFIIGGASCPDILIEKIIQKILSFYPHAALQGEI